MKPFAGQATLHISGHEAKVLLSLDMDAGAFEAELPAGVIPNDILQQGEGEAKEVAISNLRIHLPSGTLSADRLDEITLGCNSTVTNSVKTSPISLALNLADDRSGTIRFFLEPKAAMIHLRHDPPLTNKCELYFLNNFIDPHMPITLKNHDTDLYFQPRKCSLSITSTVDIRPVAKQLGVAWSVFQGAHVTHTASYWNSTLDLAVRKHRTYSRVNHLFRGWNNAQSLLQSLTDAFLKMPEDDFNGWSKAVRFYLEVLNDDLDYDLHIVNFMVFIEMFDKSATMSKQTISETFAVSIELADLVVRMRNKIIHERMTMWRALPQVYSDILQHQPNWRCPEIDFTSRNYELLSILFFLHLQRMVNTFIVRTVNYTGNYNDCTALIGSIERKLG
ncbi:MAG: hypothetical protein Q7J98_07850 [Kiritimatiellia bacterium]|nr:hypothetical protein [Kiritimatiellia bacterium]